ncbi:MAG: hypothetical protein PVI96_00775, partial [Desulfobacterales bacterium]
MSLKPLHYEEPNTHKQQHWDDPRKKGRQKIGLDFASVFDAVLLKDIGNISVNPNSLEGLTLL